MESTPDADPQRASADATTSGTAGSAAAAKPPGGEAAPPGVIDELGATFAAGRRVISDFLTLATLEARQAGMSAMWMVAGGVAAAILGVSAWFALMAALAIAAV